jgi:hypothetical protein
MMQPHLNPDCPANDQYMPTLKPITAATVIGFLISDNWTLPSRNDWMGSVWAR